MSERLSARNTLKGGLAAATSILALAGCGAESTQDDNDKPKCTVQAANWMPVQGIGKDNATIAELLDTKAIEVEQGSMAAAQCDPGIPNEEFKNPITVEDVPEGISNKCLPIQSETVDTVGTTSLHPLIVCPALNSTN